MCTEIIKLIVIGVISFITVVVIWRIIHVHTESEKGWGEHSTKLVGIIFIVAVALIAYIYDASNSSSPFALFGTLAGYFLGSREKKDKE